MLHRNTSRRLSQGQGYPLLDRCLWATTRKQLGQSIVSNGTNARSLILYDIIISVQLLIDDFARNGYRTIAPDILNDDAIIDFNAPNFDRNAWIAKHGPESWIPTVDGVVAALKAEGVTRFGTTGYCFGAPPAWHLALKNESHVTVVAHPSRLRIPEDLEVRHKNINIAKAWLI